MFYRAVLIVGYSNDVFEAFRKIIGAWNVFLLRQRFHLIYSVEGEGKDFLVIVVSAQQEPTVVVLLEQIRVEAYTTD